MIAAIAGYSGLTGSFLKGRISSDKAFGKVILNGRSVPGDLRGKFEFDDTSFDALRSKKIEKLDAGFCLLGTTIKKAGSQENFRKVDFEYVLDFAKHCKLNGAREFHLMSSIGAKADSSNFYLRTKGETEEAVKALGFDSLFIYRPSMLLGPRKESRLGESIGKGLFTALGFLLMGSFRKYRGIHVSRIANAMLRNAKDPKPGVHYIYYDDMP